jgi:SAM-dependent methyltransferase
MKNAFKSRRVTNCLRYVMDDWLPPIVREFRPLSRALANLFHGRHFDLDFKRKAYQMSEADFRAAYARLPEGKRSVYRLTDMTEGQLRWMVENAEGPKVLEVGCGYGVLAERLARRGDLEVVATDLSPENVEATQRRAAEAGLALEARTADVEALPFADKSFDTSLCAHTLEHVRDFEQAIRELVRVTRRRLLVIVPCQRYYRYTIDYHLHFFPEPEQLILRMGLANHYCVKLQGDLVYRADLSPSEPGCNRI